MKIVSYVTEEYQHQGERLKECLERLKLSHNIEFIKSKGSAKANKIWKPFFLEKQFNKFPNEQLTLVDGDSYFVKRPPEIIIKKDMGLVESGATKEQYWFSDAIHIHAPTQGTKEFIRIWKSLCKYVDFIASNNHPRILAAFYLSRKMTTYEFIDLKKTFRRNYGQHNESVY